MWPLRKLLFEFRITVHSGDGEDARPDGAFYGFFSCGNLAASLLPFRLNVILCVPTEGHPHEVREPQDYDLVYSRVEHIVSQAELPFVNSDIVVGMLDSYCLYDWVANIIPNADEDMSVATQRLSYIELLCDGFRVLGVVPGLSRVVSSWEVAPAFTGGRL